jgi:hypothetical protein
MLAAPFSTDRHTLPRLTPSLWGGKRKILTKKIHKKKIFSQKKNISSQLRFFAASGVQSAQSNMGASSFHFRRAAFSPASYHVLITSQTHILTHRIKSQTHILTHRIHKLLVY